MLFLYLPARRLVPFHIVAQLLGEIYSRIKNQGKQFVFDARIGETVCRPGDGKARDHITGIVHDRDGNAFDRFFILFIIDRIPLASDLAELMEEDFRVGDGFLRIGFQRGFFKESDDFVP